MHNRNRVAGMHLRDAASPVPVRVYWPGEDQLAPLLVFCAAGAGAGADASCRALSSAAGLVVLSVRCDVTDGHHGTVVLEWAAEHGAELTADPARLLVAGEGAGAVAAAAVVLAAAGRGWPAVTRQVLIDPGTIGWPAAAGLPAATVVTVPGRPGGDGGRYAGRLRSARVPVREVRCSAPDLTSGKALAAVARSIRVSLADESWPPATSCDV
jgi:hypothetical protein